jgi:hypothetical protein
MGPLARPPFAPQVLSDLLHQNVRKRNRNPSTLPGFKAPCDTLRLPSRPTYYAVAPRARARPGSTALQTQPPCTFAADYPARMPDHREPLHLGQDAATHARGNARLTQRVAWNGKTQQRECCRRHTDVLSLCCRLRGAAAPGVPEKNPGDGRGFARQGRGRGYSS